MLIAVLSLAVDFVCCLSVAVLNRNVLCCCFARRYLMCKLRFLAIVDCYRKIQFNNISLRSVYRSLSELSPKDPKRSETHVKRNAKDPVSGDPTNCTVLETSDQCDKTLMFTDTSTYCTYITYIYVYPGLSHI